MDKNWRAYGDCNKLKEQDIEDIFWIGPGKSANRARNFCARCPVKQDCRNYAIMYKERGIWGGTTEEERDSMDPWIGEQLRLQERQNGTLETRNIVEFLMPREALAITQSLAVDLEVQQLLEPLEELSEALDRLYFVASDQQAS